MENISLFGELPSEILLEILDPLNRFQLFNLVRVNRRIRGIAQYLLEHRKKIRLCGETLRVLILSPPSKYDDVVTDSHGLSRATLLTHTFIYETPSNKSHFRARQDNRSQKRVKQIEHGKAPKTKTIVMIEGPNSIVHRRKLYIDAVAADLCLLIVDPQEIDEYTEYIKEVVFGCCFVMSARNVIVAVDLQSYQSEQQHVLHTLFNEAKTKMAKLLNRTVGMCYTIIPVDIRTGCNIVPIITSPLPDTIAKYPWYTGPSLKELLIADQLRTNSDELSYKKRCEEPLNFQMMMKYKISGIGTVLEGRIMSGTLKPGDRVTIFPGAIASETKSIEANWEMMEQAKPGDIVGINVRAVNVRDIQHKFTYLVKAKETLTVNCTQAFRAQIVVMKSDRFTQHQIYQVFYGPARIPCILWWIFPEDGKNHDRSERKLKIEYVLPQKPILNLPRHTTTTFKQLYEYRARVKKEKEIHNKQQAESGINYVRPPKQTLKKATAILLPLIHYDIETYKPSAFEKNHRGKVMLMEKSAIVGVGRVDRVFSTTAQTFNALTTANYQAQYENVVAQASTLFNLPTEQKQLELFLDHVTTNDHAKKSIQRLKSMRDDS